MYTPFKLLIYLFSFIYLFNFIILYQFCHTLTGIHHGCTCVSHPETLIPGSGRSPGAGNGNWLQYFCRDNPMDRRAWWATVHRVSKESDTTQQLSTCAQGRESWFVGTSDGTRSWFGDVMKDQKGDSQVCSSFMQAEFLDCSRLSLIRSRLTRGRHPPHISPAVSSSDVQLLSFLPSRMP